MLADCSALMTEVRSRRPLIHNITNYVVMNITANALLAIGAAPVMAHALEEIEEMASLADALVLNLGTLSPPWINAMQRAAQTVHARRIPIVLDPVGAGATQLRTQTARDLIHNSGIRIIRGNASEIAALANDAIKTRGVDSTLTSDRAVDAARLLAQQYAATIVVSGTVDHIITPHKHIEVHNGDRIMAQVTGMGCVATALLGAFAAASPDTLVAAVATQLVMGIAGEQAASQAKGPGTFVPHFLYALACLQSDTLPKQARLLTRA